MLKKNNFPQINNVSEEINLLIINGPNLNLLGHREPEIYGKETLEDINQKLIILSKELETKYKKQIKLYFEQSNVEGEIINFIHEGYKNRIHGLIINAGAYTHTSIAIRDAITSTQMKTIEVHLSNIYKREDFRKQSYISEVSIGQICGFGSDSYLLALMAILKFI